mgnify:CR=1 FL=1
MDRAITETGCAGVMIGRRAIQHPWVFREARALLDEGRDHPPPTAAEREDVHVTPGMPLTALVTVGRRL